MKIEINDKIRNIEVSEPKHIAKILVRVLKAESKNDRNKEHMWGIYLTARNNIKKIELISLGSLNTSIVHPREIYAPLFRLNTANEVSKRLLLCLTNTFA